MLKKDVRNLSEKAFQKLEKKIITLQLKPGELYTELEFSELINIGRMPTREAIKKLEASYLVKILPRQGIMISEIKSDELQLQFELRVVLERLLVSRTIDLATNSEKKKFSEMADVYEKATIEDDSQTAIEIDHEFNKFLSKCSRNHYISKAINPLHALSRRIYYMQYHENKELTKEVNMNHVHLMRSITSSSKKEALEYLDILMLSIKKLNNLEISFL